MAHLSKNQRAALEALTEQDKPTTASEIARIANLDSGHYAAALLHQLRVLGLAKRYGRSVTTKKITWTATGAGKIHISHTN